MKKSKQKKNADKSAESTMVSAEEALRRMKDFGERKEKIIASVSKSKN